MPKQNLDLLDYFGPLAASIVFFSVIFVISVTCILWFCVSEKDDQTVFDKWGMCNTRRARRSARLSQQQGEFTGLAAGSSSGPQAVKA
uniref:Neuropeptide-like protein 36 n=4 Tax=Meloidogyne TaxID=189290 RepID=A0A914KFN2_MELIC